MLLHCGSILFWFERPDCFIHSEAIDSDNGSIQKTIQKEKVLAGHDLVLPGQIWGNNSRKLVEQGNRALQLVLYWRMQAIVNWRTNKTCPEPPKWRVRSCRVGSLLPMCVLLGSLDSILPVAGSSATGGQSYQKVIIFKKAASVCRRWFMRSKTINQYFFENIHSILSMFLDKNWFYGYYIGEGADFDGNHNKRRYPQSPERLWPVVENRDD